MKAPFNLMPAVLAAGFVVALGAAGPAHAGGKAGCGCSPHPSPPHVPHFRPFGHFGFGVNVSASVNVAVVAAAGAQAGGAVIVGGGGGGASYGGPGPTGFIDNFHVDGEGVSRTAYDAERTKIKKVLIEVVCIDDKDVPHPGSQVTPDRNIDDVYEGELYRCIAGTHLRATIADYNETLSFDHGWTMDCDKGQALYHSKGGAVACRVQTPARDCNERSLLRRFGAGIKILTMITTERYTAYHEESTHSSSSSAGSMSTDGGVGGMYY